MAWQTEMVTIFRHTIDDLATPPLYADSRIQELLLVAARYVISEADFIQNYVVDITGGTLTPDPTTGTRDENFITLVSVKAACILSLGAMRVSAGQAIDIRDGSSAISLKGIFGGKEKVAKSYCDMYEQLLWENQVGGNVGMTGQIIVTPYAINDWSNGGRCR